MDENDWIIVIHVKILSIWMQVNDLEKINYMPKYH
jgi:hypothetical protein